MSVGFKNVWETIPTKLFLNSLTYIEIATKKIGLHESNSMTSFEAPIDDNAYRRRS